jgi:hypothetical protein
MIGNKK